MPSARVFLPLPPAHSAAVNVSVLDTTHSLYCHVHHHYGLNDAFERSVGMLLRRQELPPAVVASPPPAVPSATQDVIADAVAGGDGSGSGGGISSTGEGRQAPVKNSSTVQKDAPRHEPQKQQQQKTKKKKQQQQVKQQQRSSEGQGGDASSSTGESGASTMLNPAEQRQAALEAAAAAQQNSRNGSGSGSSDEPTYRRSMLLAVPEVLLRRRARLRDPQLSQAGLAAADVVEEEVWRLQRQLLAEERQAWLDPVKAGPAAGPTGDSGSAAELQLPFLQQQQARRQILRSAAAEDGEPDQAAPSTERRQQREAGGLVAVPHPCLHEGYSQPYKRLVIDGVPPEPPEVLLTGRWVGFFCSLAADGDLC